MLKLAQLLGQCARCDAAQQTIQLVEPLGALPQTKQDHTFPFATNQIQRGFHGAGIRVIDFVALLSHGTGPYYTK
jgi:ABC-type hemin transport system ATPase subunit